MRRKISAISGDIIKYKARLNVDGSKQCKGVHYDESWSPVASWTTIRTVMLLGYKYNWKSVQVDFVQAFPQAPIERKLYMNIP